MKVLYMSHSKRMLQNKEILDAGSEVAMSFRY